MTDTQNSANSQRQNARAAQDTEQTAQNPTNQNENSQFSTPTNTPKNSLENYKKLDYTALSDDEKSEGYIFHILTDKISESTRKKLENLAQTLAEIYPCEIEIHFCDDSIFQNFPKFKDNYLAYFRFLIPNFMPQSLKMCLYLDVDMLAMQDLRALFTLDLGDKAAAATLDVADRAVAQPISKNPKKPDFDFEGFYINSGFLLMNLREWQRQDILQKSFDFLLNYRTWYHDQDALSAALRHKTLVLPFEYNCLTHLYYPSEFADFIVYRGSSLYTNKQVKFALENPIILHWGGDGKPFYNENCRVDTRGELLGLRWWKIAFETPCFADELRGILANLQAGRGGGESEFERLKRLEHFGGFVRFYTRKQLAKIRRFFAKIRRKTRFIRYPIKRFFGFGGERV